MNPLEAFTIGIIVLTVVVAVGERIHAFGAHRGWWDE